MTEGEKNIVALILAIALIAGLTVRYWGPAVDGHIVTEQEIADRHLRAYVQARGCQ